MQAFEWDLDKSRQNQRKHGFGFQEVQKVFADSALLIELDDRDYGETRWAAIGQLGPIIAYVVHTNRHGVIRLISARRATPDEEERYYSRWFGAY